MRFIKSLALRLRLLRRRHRNLFIATFLLLLLTAFALLYVWQDYTASELHSVIGAKGECGFLPSFLCRWKSSSLSSMVDKPFDPLTLPISSDDKDKDTETAQDAQQQKEDYEKSLSDADKKKLAQIRSLVKALDLDRLKLGHAFYKNIFKDLIKAKPKIDKKLDRYKNGDFCKSERYDDGKYDPLFSEEYLSSFLQVTRAELEALTESHNYIKTHLPEKAPYGLYEGNGIVYVGGGKFNWLTLLSIRTLRGTGCNIPVEILIPSLEEYDIELCTKVFPSMNAKCIFLPTALYGDDLEFASHLSFKGYQYKSLAILLSSFENVLLLDSDNLVAYSPDHLFTNEPFSSRGLVVWPDYWRRSTSPSFYKISGEIISKDQLLPRYQEHFGYYKPQSMADDLDWYTGIPYHERAGAIPDPSSESGQLMVSKKTHLKAILLALYYNTYGPKFYYPIFSQGVQGEGDKETFLAATVVLKKSFYQVGRFLTSLGNVKKGEYTGHAMGQHDPVEDFKLVLEKKELAFSFQGKELDQALEKKGSPKMLFLHANYPKLDPWALREAGETLDNDGRHRLYGWSLRWRTGTDLEMDIWRHMDALLCKESIEIDHFKNVNRAHLCAEVHAQIRHLENTVEKLE